MLARGVALPVPQSQVMVTDSARRPTGEYEKKTAAPISQQGASLAQRDKWTMLFVVVSQREHPLFFLWSQANCIRASRFLKNGCLLFRLD